MKTCTNISENNYIISNFNVTIATVTFFKLLITTFYSSVYPSLHFS